MELVSENPSLVFELIKEGHIEFVDMLLKKKIVDINTCDEAGNNILVRLLKCGAYDVVLHHMGNKEWDVNHQNLDGNTFAHVLVSLLFLRFPGKTGRSVHLIPLIFHLVLFHSVRSALHLYLTGRGSEAVSSL